jgi:hypothetical protein
MASTRYSSSSAGTPPAIVQTLNEEIAKAASKDPIKGRLLKEGA